MDFFAVSAVGVVGVCNTATTICISIRTCFKANKNIGGLFDDAVALLENIEDLVRRSSVFLVAGTIDIVDFCYFAGKIEKVRDTLEELKNKLEKKRYQVHPFFSGTESVAALDYACHKLRHVAIEMRLMVGVARIGVKTSVIETQGPILDAAAAIIPGNNGVRDKQRMMENAQQAFSTHTLKSRLNKLASGDTRSAEGQLCITKGKRFLDGLTVKVDYENSASFFITQ